MTPPSPEVKALFRAPFKTCPMDLFVMSEDGNMAASPEDDEGVMPRGWGFIQKRRGGDRLYDAWCDWFEANIPRGVLAPECARLLNEAWK